MGKKLIVFGGIFLSLMVLTGIAFSADKFAYVDLGRIFREYTKTKEYDKTLADKQTTYESGREKRVNEIKQFQDKVNLLSDKEKEAKKSELETKIKGLQDFDRDKQEDLRKERDEKMKELLKDIDEEIKKYSEAEGYVLVFNDRVLVYQDKSLDISDKIIEGLNKNYKK